MKVKGKGRYSMNMIIIMEVHTSRETKGGRDKIVEGWVRQTQGHTTEKGKKENEGKRR